MKIGRERSLFRGQGTRWRLAGKPGMLMCIGLIMCNMVGCGSPIRAKSSRPVRVEPMEIILQSDATSYGLARLGVLPFVAPGYAPGAEKEITNAYWQEILRGGIFLQPVLISRPVKTDGEAIWWGRHEGCDLVMNSAITYFMDGTGALPTRLETSIQILDVRSGKVLWKLRQKAYSEPGPDVDLFWTTIPGSPAQRYYLLAKSLAEQLLQYLRNLRSA